jgi:hypothetical protein
VLSAWAGSHARITQWVFPRELVFQDCEFGGVTSLALGYAASCVADDVISGGGREACFPEHDVSAGLQ